MVKLLCKIIAIVKLINFAFLGKELFYPMKGLSHEDILTASRPSDIFTMDPSTLKSEAEEYLSRLKPEAYRTVENFILSQKIKTLFQQAREELSLIERGEETSTLHLCSTSGSVFNFGHVTAYPSKLGKMYDAPENVIFCIKPQYRKYYDNYLAKTRNYQKIDRKIWNVLQYMLPNVTAHFEEKSGELVIILKKPSKMYPLRELLEYFGNRMKPEYVASIITRLYYFVSYISLLDLNHNALTVDNLFFAPGRFIEEGEEFTVEDMRIVGVFGGWFFSTWSNEVIRGMPKQVKEIAPKITLINGYSSYEVDELSIRGLACELLGDPTAANLPNVPEPMKSWVTGKSIAKDAFEEFQTWKQVEKQTFNGYKFAHMDIPNNYI